VGQSHHLKVATTGLFGHASVELDGEQIQSVLAGISLHLRGGDPNSATLELLVPTVDADGEFEVMLPEATQALLKRLGWTPPT